MPQEPAQRQQLHKHLGSSGSSRVMLLCCGWLRLSFCSCTCVMIRVATAAAKKAANEPNRKVEAGCSAALLRSRPGLRATVHALALSVLEVCPILCRSALKQGRLQLCVKDRDTGPDPPERRPFYASYRGFKHVQHLT